MENEGLKSCRGSCHCGRVRFEVKLPLRFTARSCSCSICSKTGFVHVIVERQDMKLLQGKEFLTEYRFNTGTARHLFCSHCGVKSFYVPRSHPDGYSINLNCLDLDPSMQVDMEHFDGRHWRENFDLLTKGE